MWEIMDERHELTLKFDSHEDLMEAWQELERSGYNVIRLCDYSVNNINVKFNSEVKNEHVVKAESEARNDL